MEKPKPRKAVNLIAKPSFFSPGHANGRCCDAIKGGFNGGKMMTYMVVAVSGVVYSRGAE
jgi:hypothetical protein